MAWTKWHHELIRHANFIINPPRRWLCVTQHRTSIWRRCRVSVRTSPTLPQQSRTWLTTFLRRIREKVSSDFVLSYYTILIFPAMQGLTCHDLDRENWTIRRKRRKFGRLRFLICCSREGWVQLSIHWCNIFQSSISPIQSIDRFYINNLINLGPGRGYRKMSKI